MSLILYPIQKHVYLLQFKKNNNIFLINGAWIWLSACRISEDEDKEGFLETTVRDNITIK